VQPVTGFHVCFVHSIRDLVVIVSAPSILIAYGSRPKVFHPIRLAASIPPCTLRRSSSSPSRQPFGIASLWHDGLELFRAAHGRGAQRSASGPFRPQASGQGERPEGGKAGFTKNQTKSQKRPALSGKPARKKERSKMNTYEIGAT